MSRLYQNNPKKTGQALRDRKNEVTRTSLITNNTEALVFLQDVQPKARQPQEQVNIDPLLFEQIDSVHTR